MRQCFMKTLAVTSSVIVNFVMEIQKPLLLKLTDTSQSRSAFPAVHACQLSVTLCSLNSTRPPQHLMLPLISRVPMHFIRLCVGRLRCLQIVYGCAPHLIPVVALE